jgi:hypothetical protein
MTALERTVMAVPGPKFERIDGAVTFKFVIDSGSVIGPRPATKTDQENHAEAWRLFCLTADVKPLGGAPDIVVAEPVEPKTDLPAFPPPEPPLNERDTLRQDLKMLGVEVDARWGVPRLKAELDKATTPKA